MKIVVVGPQFPDSFARNICATLQRIGHDVTAIDGTRVVHHKSRMVNAFWKLAPKALPSLEKAQYRLMVRTAQQAQPALVLVTLADFPPEVVEELKQACAVPVVCWYTDACANVHRLYLVACPYDALFLKEPFMVTSLHDNLGLNTHYLPEACNPMWHNQFEVSESVRRDFACDVAGAGTLHYYRARMFELFADYDVKIWGASCPNWLNSAARRWYPNRFVAERTKSAAYRSARVFVNTISFQEFDGVNCTLFEAAGCGAFQIAEWKTSMPALFIPEREIVTYRNREELLDKVNYYLHHPEERHLIAEQAYRRAHSEHTYEHRLNRIFDLLNISAMARRTARQVENLKTTGR